MKRTANKRITKFAAFLMLGAMAAPSGSAAAQAGEPSPTPAQAQQHQASSPAPPGDTRSAQDGPQDQEPRDAATQSGSQAPASTASPANSTEVLPPAPKPNQAPAPNHQPLGAATAPSVPTVGVAASRPSGAAIAPAKQRRVRTILIRVGLLVGVAAAVGTVTALSMGSPSRPN